MTRRLIHVSIGLQLVSNFNYGIDAITTGINSFYYDTCYTEERVKYIQIILSLEMYYISRIGKDI